MISIFTSRARLAATGAAILAATTVQAQTALDRAKATTAQTQANPENARVNILLAQATPDQPQAAPSQSPATLSTDAPDVRATETDGPNPKVAAAPSSSDQVAEVVVTGSRVIKNGDQSPTPVTVLSVDDMKAVHPGTVADQLNDLPQFAGSRGQLTNPGGGSQGTSSAAANPAANTLNLRNFGYTRTLILFDGHRLAPTAPDGTVDTNMVPNMLLKRVDIVTGGASAVYGSEAVTGVVNFITDTRFKFVASPG